MDSDVLTVTVQNGPGAGTIITAAGEIDRDSRHDIRAVAEPVLQAGDHRLILDVSAVTFCDSSGLSLFVDLHRRATAAGGWLRLAGATPHLRVMLAATHLDRLLALHPTVEDAAAQP